MSEVPVHDALRGRVVAVLDERFGAGSWTDLRVLEGGHSSHTLAADVVSEGGAVVIKAGAPGRPAVGRHQVLRQVPALEAASASPEVAVPRVLASSDGDPQVFVMTMAPGAAVEPVLDGVGDLAPDTVRVRGLAAAAMLGHLHRVPVAGTAVAEEPALRVADELARWAMTLRAVDPTLVVGAEDLIAGLQATLPAERPPALVHGDYRLGNILAEGDHLTGLIDWEIWSRTDPRVDLGWFLLFCDAEEFPEVSHPAPGLPTVTEMIEEYAAVAGPVEDALWFLAFARLKMAAIMGHNLKRHREGRYHDPYQERLPPTIASMVRRGLEVVAHLQSPA